LFTEEKDKNKMSTGVYSSNASQFLTIAPYHTSFYAQDLVGSPRGQR
jgi:hypothetical protein